MTKTFHCLTSWPLKHICNIQADSYSSGSLPTWIRDMLSCSAASSEGETSSIGESRRSPGLPWQPAEPPDPRLWGPAWRPSLLPPPRCSNITTQSDPVKPIRQTEPHHDTSRHHMTHNTSLASQIWAFWSPQNLDSLEFGLVEGNFFLSNRPSLDWTIVFPSLQVKFEIIEFPTNKVVLQNLEHECDVVGTQ